MFKFQNTVEKAKRRDALNQESQRQMKAWIGNKNIPTSILKAYDDNLIISFIKDLKLAGYRVSDTINNNTGPLPERKIVVTGLLQDQTIELIKLNIEVKPRIRGNSVLPYFFGICDYVWGTDDSTYYHHANLNEMSRIIESVKRSVLEAITNRGILPINEPTPIEDKGAILGFIQRILFREN